MFWFVGLTIGKLLTRHFSFVIRERRFGGYQATAYQIEGFSEF
jgi:hypothetical protein